MVLQKMHLHTDVSYRYMLNSDTGHVFLIEGILQLCWCAAVHVTKLTRSHMLFEVWICTIRPTPADKQIRIAHSPVSNGFQVAPFPLVKQAEAQDEESAPWYIMCGVKDAFQA